MFGINYQEILIVGAVALLLFGPLMLPRLARGFGDTLREFRKSVQEVKKTLDE